jgi:hypothetical protein
VSNEAVEKCGDFSPAKRTRAVVLFSAGGATTRLPARREEIVDGDGGVGKRA